MCPWTMRKGNLSWSKAFGLMETFVRETCPLQVKMFNCSAVSSSTKGERKLLIIVVMRVDRTMFGCRWHLADKVRIGESWMNKDTSANGDHNPNEKLTEIKYFHKKNNRIAMAYDSPDSRFRIGIVHCLITKPSSNASSKTISSDHLPTPSIWRCSPYGMYSFQPCRKLTWNYKTSSSLLSGCANTHWVIV